MATTPNYSQPAIFSEVATPTVPDSGYLKVYANSGTLCSITNGGTEKSYVAISGSGLPIGAYTLPTTDGTASQILQTNGSGTVTWQTVSGGGGGGITSINGDSTAAQLLTVGTAGTDFAIDSVTTAGTSVFNIPDASATARGLITTGPQTFIGQKTFSSSTITTSQPLEVTQTWNNAAIAFTAFNITVNNTAFSSSSKLFNFSCSNVVGGGTVPAVSFTPSTGTLRVDGPWSMGKLYLGSSGQSINAVYASGLEIRNNAPDALLLQITTGYGDIGTQVGNASYPLGWAGVKLRKIADNELELRSGTNAQLFRLSNTWTSTTSFEAIQFKAVAGAAYQIGSAIGSAGGTNRAITFGHWNTAGAFVGTAKITDHSFGTGWGGRFSDDGGAAEGAERFGDKSATSYQSLAVGGAATATANFATAIGRSSYAGYYCTSLGRNAGTTGTTGGIPSAHAYSYDIVISDGTENVAPTASSQFIVAGLWTEAYFGKKVTHATPLDVRFNATGGSGANIAGASFTLAGGKGTGTGAGGSLIFQTAPAGSTGSTLNSLVTRLTIDSTGLSTFAGAITASNLSGTNTGDQDLSSYATTSAVAAGYVSLSGTNTITGLKTFRVDGGPMTQTFQCYNPSTANGVQILNYKARGSLAIPLYPAANDIILGHYCYGHDENAGAFSGVKASYICSIPDAWTATSNSTQWTWVTTDTLDATKTAANRMRLQSDGSLTVGGITQSGGLLELVKSNTGLTGFGTALNRMRFSDTDTTTAANQPIGEIEFYSADATAPGAGVKGSFLCVAESATPAAAFVWGLDAVAGSLTEQMRLSSVGLLTVVGGIKSTKGIYFTSEPTGTPSGTTQTLTLADGNHQTLALTSATGTVTATLTVPSGSSSGTIIVKQHASAAKDITWAVSAGTIKWMGTEPDWVADAISSVRIVSWRYDGSVMYLMSTDVGA